MDLTKQFECVVCLHVAVDPAKQTPCGQVYCKECLAPCKLCHVCREPLNASSTEPFHEVKKMGMRVILDFLGHPWITRTIFNVTVHVDSV